MTRSATTLACLALTAVLLPGTATAQSPTPAPAAAAAPAGLSEADVAPFLGDWTITGESPMGPFSNALSIKREDGKVSGNISSEIQAPTVITEVSKTGDSLVLYYSFDYEGNTVPTVLTLTPKAEQLDVHFSFADGAFEMAGVGSKAVAK